jgi:hypothetical protein
MAALAEHTNVFDTAFAILCQKGYQIWFEPDSSLYCAEKDGWDFASESPLGLLGAVGIFEFVQPEEWKEYWWKIPRAVPSRSLPETPRVHTFRSTKLTKA